MLLLLPLALVPARAPGKGPHFRVDEIAWLAGHWGSNRAMGQEEWWTAPRAA